MDRREIETNYIILQGLKNIKNKGFQTLIEAQSFSLKDKAVAPYSGLTPIDIAFYIAPLINAITRVGTMQEKETMFYCFIEPERLVPSTKRGAAAGDMETAAEQTARAGANAKGKQNRIKEKAMNLIDFKIQKNQLNDNNILVVELDPGDDIPQEMTGLIAMAVVSKYNKPCMIGRKNEDNQLQGSIRNNGNFAGLPSFKKFLEESSLMNYVAGHDNSAGWGMAANNLDKLLAYSNTELNASDFENCYLVDYVLDAVDNNFNLLYKLAEHPEFFGNHVDEIRIVIKNLPSGNFITMGANKDSAKISYNGIDYVRFKDEEFINEIRENRLDKLTIFGSVNLNSWMGRTSVQIIINDYQLENEEDKYSF